MKGYVLGLGYYTGLFLSIGYIHYKDYKQLKTLEKQYKDLRCLNKIKD
jgi:hypothetical protein